MYTTIRIVNSHASNSARTIVFLFLPFLTREIEHNDRALLLLFFFLITIDPRKYYRMKLEHVLYVPDPVARAETCLSSTVLKRLRRMETFAGISENLDRILFDRYNRLRGRKAGRVR